MNPVQFAVVSPAFCCERWVQKCIGSIRSQTHGQFRCVMIDACSTDRTYERARHAVEGDDRFTILRNPVRQYPLANIVEATRHAAQAPDDVIVIVDGDDWLKHDRVFERLASLYADPEAWLTYGGSELRRRPLRARLLGRPHLRALPYPEAVRRDNLYRYHPGNFPAAHLRSYRKFLWDALRDEDLRDADGQYFRAAGDFATMLPMMEMATDRHIRHLTEVMYVYNNDHPLNENRQAVAWTATEAYRVNLAVRARPPYAPLGSARAT